jgi:hypothetical protein
MVLCHSKGARESASDVGGAACELLELGLRSAITRSGSTNTTKQKDLRASAPSRTNRTRRSTSCISA